MPVVAEMPDMTGYGVDASTWEPLPWSWAAERLAAARNVWLTTVSAQGRPHSMPLWAVWNEAEHLLGFSCAPTARKVRNLATNPQAVVTTESTTEVLSIEGRCTRLERSSLMDEWIDRWVAKYQPLEPGVSAEFLVENAFYVFTPSRAFAVIESADEFATRATRWRFS